MTLGDILAAFGEQLAQLWPFRVISAWEQGARARLGVVSGPLTHENGWRGTGLHWMWPFIDQIYQIDSSIEVASGKTQTCTTADGVDVAFDLVLRYRVVDAAQMFRSIYEGGETVVTEAMGAAGELAGTIESETFACEIGDAVSKDIEGRLQGWGIQLEEVRVSTCVFPRTFRLIGDARS